MGVALGELGGCGAGAYCERCRWVLVEMARMEREQVLVETQVRQELGAGRSGCLGMSPSLS